MQRQLIVLRHAKSSWKNADLSDHQRPLNRRGQQDAPRVGAYLSEVFGAPAVVLCSDARRARETWERMAHCFTSTPIIHYSGHLYHAAMGELRQELAWIDDDVGSVLVIGHNPGWEYVVGWLADENVRMTTCNAAILRSNGTSWEEAISERGTWELVEIVRPKEI